MTRYIARRLAAMVPILIGVSILTFLILYMLPGDPALIALGGLATAESYQALRKELLLDEPLLARYWAFVVGAVRGDFGRSFQTKRPVMPDLVRSLGPSLQLAATSMSIALLVGVPVGVLSAVHRSSLTDLGIRLLALGGVSLPSFWLGLMLILTFSVKLRLLPTSGYGMPGHLVLPSITLASFTLATIIRLARSAMLDVLCQDFIRTARAKGLVERTVIFRHGLKNALIPIITVAGLQFGVMVGGAVLTETVFAWPGIGRLMVDAIKRQDIPVVQGSILVMVCVFLLVNLTVDLMYTWLDPRISYD